jgi:HlyD family secretion protein
MLFPPEIVIDTTESLFVRRSTRSYIVYMAVILAITAIIAALPFVYVEISAQARGIIRTSLENNQLQSAVYGEAIDVRLSENKGVIEGDTLLIINTENIDVQINRLIEKMNENTAFISDISALLETKSAGLKTPKYINEYNYYQTSFEESKTKVNYLENEFSVTEELYNKKVTSESEYLQYKNNYETALRQLENLKEQFRNRWQAERTNFEIEIRELQSNIRQLEEEKTKYILKAPATGSIIEFTGVQPGNFIAPGQIIAQISVDNDLLVECYVSPADIGFIKKHQEVSFQMDAFNYNQWGMAHGSVLEISDDVTVMNDEPVFKIRCSLDEKYLKLKNGYMGNLKKGMTLNGRFRLTDRTLWQLLFDKVDNWLNPNENQTT